MSIENTPIKLVNLKETNEIITRILQEHIISEKTIWIEKGLAKQPAVWKSESPIIFYYLNFYALDLLTSKLSTGYSVLSKKDLQKISEAQIARQFKGQKLGSVSHLGAFQNRGFSDDYWFYDTLGEKHAFKAVLTDLSDSVYIKKARKEEGAGVLLIKV